MNTPRTNAEAWIHDYMGKKFSFVGADFAHQLETEVQELRAALEQAVRYIEVSHAYKDAMTAAQVEARILQNANISEIEIGAHSANTLARFNFAYARELLAKVPK